MAYRDIPDNRPETFSEYAEKDLIFVGMMAMIDPPRPEVSRAISECIDSGISIIMITGDYELTAQAIAKSVGLIKNEAASAIINGETLRGIKDHELIMRIKNGAKVFARITPEQKLRIATTLRRSGAVIAMTGDGVNDAPALKKADIGVAMGIIGTDVSKEAADMILMDDNFSSIVAGVKEGRTIFQNIKKFVHYVFTSNASEFFTVVIGVALGIPSPIAAVQILAIDLGTDVFPSLALGVEPIEPGVLKTKVNAKKNPVIGKKEFFRIVYLGLIMAGCSIFAFLWSMKRGGWSFGQDIDTTSWLYMKSTTATYTVLAITQFANLFSSRSETRSPFQIGFFKNRSIFIALLLSLLLLYAFMNVEFISSSLRMTAIDHLDWSIAFGAMMLIFLTEETRKFFVRTAQRRREAKNINHEQ
jgi:magnesium-transporting ATPase (P-type)